MYVIAVLPSEGPKITTDQMEYTVGDEIEANCTSDRTNLDMLLNFTINDEPVSVVLGLTSLDNHSLLNSLIHNLNSLDS